MSADTKNLSESFAEQLASFDDKLHSTADDVDLLADIQNGIGRLLATADNSEAEIRRVLQERYDAGGLRKETFQLVKSLLDRYSSENIPTSAEPEALPQSAETSATAPEPPGLDHPVPPVSSNSPPSDDTFSTTTVIPADAAAVGITPANIADGPVQVGSVLRDRFLLQEKISGGSMGVVYKAMDRRLAEAGSTDHWVAIKVISPQLAKNGDALRALQQEAAKGRCLVHPNIVRFIDLDREDELYFLVMEWLEGRTLAEILDSKDAGTIDTAAAFQIVRDIGQALEYAHRCGIVHADVKPGNIMITPNGDAKLFDFGVARVNQQQTESDFDPGVLGAMTPAYSSMQVLTGEEPTPADDVFSLACLLYRLLAGHRVFGPRNAAEASQEGMAPQRLKSVNDSQWRAMKKALSYSRVTRFSSVMKFSEALSKNPDEPFRVEAPDRFAASDDDSRSSRWLLGLLALSLVAAGAAYQVGYLDPLIDRLSAWTQSVGAQSVGEGVEQSEVELNSDGATVDEQTDLSAPFVDTTSAEDPEVSNATGNTPPLESNDKQVESEAVLADLADDVLATTSPPEGPLVGPDPMLVDFSSLPPATEIIPFTPGRSSGKPVNIAVREDGADAVIDFVRGSNLSVPMTLRLEEVGFSGNRSPWASGQYALSNSGQIHFPAGQARGRVTLKMASDPLREADQQSTLRLREADYVNSELALLNVTLEDDDQRDFESRLPANTVAFAASQASIRETDPAVQIDLQRFNPDNSALEIAFTVSDITATEGQDYFAPGSYLISFGPRQRSARLLIPLVQDAEVEGDEAFVVELASDPVTDAIDVYRRIVIMIRDDEPQGR